MDAAALLAYHGWRGAGHGLGHNGRGIVKPLLISNKQDALGLGKKKTLVADQWWMRAYDDSLKQLGTGKQTALSSIKQNCRNKGGLYEFFVKGEGLLGTIPESSTGAGSSSSQMLSSDNSTSPTTPEPTSVVESLKTNRKRSRSGCEISKRMKKDRDAVVVRSKGEVTKKAHPSQQDPVCDARPDAATEDIRLLCRSARKAKRQHQTRGETQRGQGLETGGLKMSTGETVDLINRERAIQPLADEYQGAADRHKYASGICKPMSEKRLKKYAVKAAENGITLAAYLAKRDRKKDKAKKQAMTCYDEIYVR